MFSTMRQYEKEVAESKYQEANTGFAKRPYFYYLVKHNYP